MKLHTTYSLLGLLILTGGCRLYATDETLDHLDVTQTLTLEGNFDMFGNTFSFGTNTATSSPSPGLIWTFSNPAQNGNIASLSSQMSYGSGGVVWSWDRLDSEDYLMAPAMTLIGDESGSSTILEVGGHRVLTESDLVSLCPVSPTSLDIRGAVTATGGVTAGGEVVANGFRTASSSTVLTLGTDAAAFGGNSEASAANSFAVGGGSRASGPGAFAANSGQAEGESSVAIGYGTLANGWRQTVLGLFNVPSESSNSTDLLNESDLILIVGNGGPSATNTNRPQSNALTIRLDGGTAIGTDVTSNAGGQVVVGRHNDTTVISGIDANSPSNKTTGAFVVGAGTDASNRKNALRVLDDGTVLVQRSGDLSMGNFTAGPQP